MFIEKAYRANHNFLLYLVGSVIIAIAATIGQMGLVAAILIQEGPEALMSLDENSMMTTLNANLTLFLILISFAFAIGGLIFCVKLIHDQKFKDIVTTRERFDWGRVFFGFGMIAVFSIAGTVLGYYLVPEDFVVNFNLEPFIILFLVTLIFMPIQTSAEEFIFRGYLMQGFGMLAKNRWFPLLMTSVIFGGMHYFNPEIGAMGDIVMVMYIGTGFLLGIMTLMDEGLELALGFHAGNNMIAALLVTADWTVFKTDSILKDVSDPQADFIDVAPVFIIYPIFLAILAYKYKWTGWKEKLFGTIDSPETTKKEDFFVAD
ncbi:MAG: CPBP family intramembrane glutamic endopeptidase [Leeuwenhoekiella sp.]